MRNWVSSDLEATVAVLEFLGNHSIQELAEKIARHSRLAKKNMAAAAHTNDVTE